MKKRHLGFIALATLGICLASCDFVDVLVKKIKSIVISSSSSSFVIGDSFFEKTNFSIEATYADGRKESLNKNDVTYNLTSGGKSYDISKSFSDAGSYKLTVSKDSVISNELSLTVYASAQYVTNISVSGNHEVEEEKFIKLNISVSPSQYTVPVEYSVEDTTVASILKESNFTYRVTGLKAGETNVVFKALKNALSYFETSFHIVVTESAKVEIQQTYSTYVKKCAYELSSCPTIGDDVKLLVIPVWFSDSSTYVSSNKKDSIREDINKAFFGTKEDLGWHSVSSYYKQESLGKLNLNGYTSEWYNATQSALDVSAYGNDNNTNRQVQFVKNTVDWYFTNHTSDSRKNYDYDGDGYLDGVMLIYAAPDYSVYNATTHAQTFTDNMWAYCFFAQDRTQKNQSNPGVNAFFWASYDFIYGGNAYSRTGSNYSKGDTRHCTLDAHTYIHEMGHMFGLDDYYDYSGFHSGAAGFSMQDNNVGGHDPFSLLAFGWADPYIPLDTMDITINDFQSSHDLILLTPSWNSYNSAFDEYLLLELYTPTGLNTLDCTYKYSFRYPQGPSTAGIRLWHVDSRLFTLNQKFISNIYDPSSFSLAFNNTYKSDNEGGRNSFAYSIASGASRDDYQKFDLLHLIRNDITCEYDSLAELSASHLFRANDTFYMNTFSNQFYKDDGLLDNGKSLGWSFQVKSITNNGGDSYSATISLTKE